MPRNPESRGIPPGRGVTIRPHDARIDQLVQLAGDLDDAGALGSPIWARPADAGSMAHRVGQIVEQLMEVLAEAVQRARP